MPVTTAKGAPPSSASDLPSELDALLNQVRSYDREASVEIVRKAYHFSESLHRNQKRSSGEPYIRHPLQVARILADYQLDVATVATGLLHDTVEDTATSLEEIEKHFGTEVRALVDGVTKLSKVTFRTSEEKQAENFRKMLLAMAKDIRVILVKLADRLHNMRTLQHLPTDKQTIIAQETLDIYSPLANRLGLARVKQELEDLGLRFTKPEVYYQLVQSVSQKLKEREKYTGEVQRLIEQSLLDHGYSKFLVTGRPKHFYSIHKKMETRNVPFDQIYDLQGFRIIVETLEQCYAALGIIHSMWTPIPGRFKDYVAIPKANMYQSLHTTVIGKGGERIEIQIRTQKMHETAEKGIAAHWAYKEGKAAVADDKFKWLSRLVEWNNEFKDPTEFIESVKLDLFAEDVYVFSPHGKVLEFPQGATPLDFAYAIHTDLGNRCVGAKVDGKLVPLKYQLVSGDTIEILVAPNQKPNKDWLKLVKTSRAKNKIRAYLKAEEFEQSKGMGLVVLERELRRAEFRTKNLLKDPNLQKAAESFSLKTVEDMLSEIGHGKLSVHKVVSRLTQKAPTSDPENKGALQQIFDRAAESSPDKLIVKVSGAEGLLVRFARCCNPVPGEAVIGFITRGRGISVHQRNCPKMLASDPHRLIEIDWDKSKSANREVKVRVTSLDRPGMLADLSKVIRDLNANITRAQIGTSRDKTAICLFTISIHDLAHLRQIIRTLEGISDVISVARVQKKIG